MKEEYLENTKNIVMGLKKNFLTFSKYLNLPHNFQTVTPTFNKDDEKLKIAKFV